MSRGTVTCMCSLEQVHLHSSSLLSCACLERTYNGETVSSEVTSCSESSRHRASCPLFAIVSTWTWNTAEHLHRTTVLHLRFGVLIIAFFGHAPTFVEYPAANCPTQVVSSCFENSALAKRDLRVLGDFGGLALVAGVQLC